MTAFDVAVVGGGPAGIAIAAQLHRSGRRVVVLERGGYDEARIGESLGGEVAPLLRALGAWDAMADVLGAQVPLLAVCSAWGDDAIVERSSMLHPLGPGWHVDRARFDSALADWATALGVEIRTRVGTCTTTRDCERVRIAPRRGDAVTARMFVDASGRGAPAGRALGDRRWLACDRQVATIARLHGAGMHGAGMRGAGMRGAELLVEAAEDGWWYSAPQPDGALVVAHVTDPDLVATDGREARFAAALARTVHTAARAGGLDHRGRVRVVRADSGRLLPDRGPAWCAVGDAALARDPLAGDGVAHALRDALELAAAIERALDRGEPVDRPDLDRRFRDYLDRRDAYYALELRWPDALFWLRRRAVGWREAPVTLHPEAVLARATTLERSALAPIEALLPPRAIAETLASLAAPKPAHEVMATLRLHAPVGDRRLLIGLQRLIERGAIAVRH